MKGTRIKKAVLKDPRFMDKIMKLFPLDELNGLLTFPQDPGHSRDLLDQIVGSLDFTNPVFAKQSSISRDTFGDGGKTNLRHICLVDCFMDVFNWVLEHWIKEPHTVFKDNDWNNSEKFREATIAVAFSTLYLSMRQIISWNYQQNMSVIDDVNNSLTESMEFMRNLIEPEKQILPEDPPSSSSSYYDFRQEYAGMLSILNDGSASELVDYILERYLNFYYLLNNLLSGEMDRANRVNIFCQLEIQNPIEVYKNEQRIWPPPLNEALPVSLIERNADQFTSKIMPFLSNEHLIQIQELQQLKEDDQTAQPEESNVPEIGIDADHIQEVLKDLSSQEIEALINTNTEEISEVVEDVLSQMPTLYENEECRANLRCSLIDVCESVLLTLNGDLRSQTQ